MIDIQRDDKIFNLTFESIYCIFGGLSIVRKCNM